MSSLLDGTWPERHRRMLAGWLAAGGPEWTPEQRKVLRWGSDAIGAYGGGIVALLGPRGSGKTLIATAMAHNALVSRQAALELARRNQAGREPILQPGANHARYWVLGDLFAAEKRSWQAGRSGWERSAQPFDRSPLDDAHHAGLLVLDEVQERGETEWEDRELTRLIDARYRACRSTVLVGNLKPDELAPRLGSSIVSRIHDGGSVLLCAWDSFRESTKLEAAGVSP
jgi:DNA replication protein DnaC